MLCHRDQTRGCLLLVFLTTSSKVYDSFIDWQGLLTGLLSYPYVFLALSCDAWAEHSGLSPTGPIHVGSSVDEKPAGTEMYY